MDISRGYSADLAYIHHHGFGDFARTAAPAILAILKKHGIAEGRVVDLGCGSGILSQILLRNGYEVTGIDYSRSMIQLAKANAPRGNFYVGSLWNFRIPPCRAVVSVGECLNYEFETTNSVAKLKKLFMTISSSLHPKGIFVFDILCRSNVQRTVNSKHWTGGQDWFVAVEKSERADRITRTIFAFRTINHRYRKSVEVHRLKKYSLGTVKTLLRKSGFRAAVHRGYRKSLGSHHVVIVAVKSSLS